MSNILQNAIFDKVGLPKFKAYLDLTSLRHKVISGNIANALTPGYKARDVNFQEQYQKAITNKSSSLSPVTTHAGHIPIGEQKGNHFKITENKNAPSNGINNVDIDKEITGLSMNQMSYTIAARMISDKFSGLRQAITGRKV